MSDRPEWMDTAQGEPRMFEPRLTLRGRIERRICADHLGGPCELSTRMTATAVDEVVAWLQERAEYVRRADGEEALYARVLHALSQEASR